MRAFAKMQTACASDLPLCDIRGLLGASTLPKDQSGPPEPEIERHVHGDPT